MMYERALQKKDVIQSYYTLVQKRRYSVLLHTLEMYKLYEFTMPLTAKAKNLLLIIQNVILLKIDILAKT